VWAWPLNGSISAFDIGQAGCYIAAKIEPRFPSGVICSTLLCFFLVPKMFFRFSSENIRGRGFLVVQRHQHL
jgi:hypothetical protein